jgi:8-oxo-dGTP pyrophosphatase MutT (NUDIX family)
LSPRLSPQARQALLQRLDAVAALPPAAPRLALQWAGAAAPFGSATAEVLQGLGFDPHSPEPNAHLAELAQTLRTRGQTGRWRDEPVRVAHPAGPAQIERACARVLGIPTLAVHLIGWSVDGGLWLQQRAATKAEDPNLWDTLVGGMVSATERPREALARETWEEAGLQLGQLGPQRPVPELHTRRPVSDAQGAGYLKERLLTVQVTLPEGVVPQNQDGEVQAFRLWRPQEVAEGLADGAFTLDAARLLLRVMG